MAPNALFEASDFTTIALDKSGTRSIGLIKGFLKFV